MVSQVSIGSVCFRSNLKQTDPVEIKSKITTRLQILVNSFLTQPTPINFPPKCHFLTYNINYQSWEQLDTPVSVCKLIGGGNSAVTNDDGDTLYWVSFDNFERDDLIILTYNLFTDEWRAVSTLVMKFLGIKNESLIVILIVRKSLSCHRAFVKQKSNNEWDIICNRVVISDLISTGSVCFRFDLKWKLVIVIFLKLKNAKPLKKVKSLFR